MTIQPRPLRRSRSAFISNNRSTRDVSGSVVANFCNCCGSRGYPGMMLQQNSPNTARRWCQHGPVCCKNTHTSDAGRQKTQTANRLFCHTSSLCDNSVFSTQRSSSAPQSANYICYQSYSIRGSYDRHLSLPSGDFQHSYKCNYTRFKCYNAKRKFEQITTKICCQSCSHCSKREVPSSRNSQTRANNFCQSCPIIGNSVCLQLVPTVAEII